MVGDDVEAFASAESAQWKAEATIECREMHMFGDLCRKITIMIECTWGTEG